MSQLDAALALARREGLPRELLFLLEQHPRAGWRAAPGLAGTGEIWLANHDYFRAAADGLVDGLGRLRLRELAPVAFGQALQRGAGRLLSSLEGHHRIEDAHYFPRFRAREPRLARGFDILDGDHHAIHEAIHDFAGGARGLLDALRAGGEPMPDALSDEAARAVESFDAMLARFRASLGRHLDDEEDLVIPLILEVARGDPEYDQTG